VAIALICKPTTSDLRALSKENYPTKKKIIMVITITLIHKLVISDLKISIDK